MPPLSLEKPPVSLDKPTVALANILFNFISKPCDFLSWLKKQLKKQTVSLEESWCHFVSKLFVGYSRETVNFSSDTVGF